MQLAVGTGSSERQESVGVVYSASIGARNHRDEEVLQDQSKEYWWGAVPEPEPNEWAREHRLMEVRLTIGVRY